MGSDPLGNSDVVQIYGRKVEGSEFEVVLIAPIEAPHPFWVFRTSQYCNDHGIAPDAATVFRRAVSDAVDAAWMQLGWIGSSR